MNSLCSASFRAYRSMSALVAPTRPVCAAAVPAAVKAPVSIEFNSWGGPRASVRRIEKADSPALAGFFRAQGLDPVRGVDEHQWMANHPEHDAVLALAGDKVVGVGSISPGPEYPDRLLDEAFLARHGYDSSSVCIGKERIDPQVRHDGYLWAIKSAQVQAARHAGFEAVATETGDPVSQAVARSMGGAVQEGAGFVWTVVPVAPRFSGEL